MSSFILANTANDYAAAQEMFRAYAAAININLDFQHFEEELSDLQTMNWRLAVWLFEESMKEKGN